jgi:hypothetical protein
LFITDDINKKFIRIATMVRGIISGRCHQSIIRLHGSARHHLRKVPSIHHQELAVAELLL